jgi:hypothetical protein
MRIFIDTEFTDFVDTELISIGLVSEDGQHEFYAELPLNHRKCSEFVVEHVLPQLGMQLYVQCTEEELEARLRAWLGQFSHFEEVRIYYDFNGDWQLFQYALGNKVPDWLVCQNIYQHIDQDALARYFEEHGVQEHHALNDAKANRYVYLAGARSKDEQTHEQPHRE